MVHIAGENFIISPATYTKTTGNINLSAGLTITAGVNDTLNFQVDGITKNITFNPGTYTSTSFLNEINDKLDLVNASVSASYSDGKLVLTSTEAGHHKIDNLSGNSLNSLFISHSNGSSSFPSYSGIPTLNPSVNITEGVNDTLTFSIGETSYTIVIPEGTYYVYNNPTLNEGSPLLSEINNQLQIVGAPVTVKFVYYEGGPPGMNGTGLHFEVGTNGVISLPDGDYSFGNFSGNAKSTLFDSFVIGWTPYDSSNTYTGTITRSPVSITGNVDLSNGISIDAGVNDTLDFEVDGVFKTVSLNDGTYDAADLLNEINNQLSYVNAGITASYSDGYLTFTHNTTGEGHSIQIISGNAINSLLINTNMGVDETYGTSDSIHIQSGPKASDSLIITIGDVRCSSLKIDDISVVNQKSANTAISLIDNAIQKVSTEISKLGAYQNRLEHILNNSNNYEINLISSTSRIKDADMAKEMMELIKNNILLQSSQALLVQVNNLHQSLLSMYYENFVDRF